MSHVLGLVTRNAELIERDRNDAAIVLDLANSNTKHFAKRNGWTVALWSLCIGENQQALGVTVHASCEVIDPVEQREAI